ncbi:HAD family phosphatase [Ruminococcaceae bacterium OttesenSCG-928-A16]|nr:HAD family phosphatase [Ruminococcaceae bacterium OttesenSCG-928-A16]
MYRNIVFDLGGVVVNYSPKDFLTDLFFHERTEKRLYDAVFGSPEWLRLDKGDLTWQQASAIFLKRGKEKDLGFEMQALLDEWQSMLTTRKATVVLMRLLKKKGFNLYYLSNISRDVLDMLSQRNFWPLFSGGVASYEVQTLKPEPEMYQALLNKYNLVPEETIFIDDNEENADAAFTVGVTGILFNGVPNLCKTMVEYGVDLVDT